MFTPTFDEQWLLEKFADVDDSFINTGGLRGEEPTNELLVDKSLDKVDKFSPDELDKLLETQHKVSSCG
jgi:hypothetical protein